MDYSGEDLLQIWRESNLPQRELARRLGLNFNAMHGLLFRAQQAEKRLDQDTLKVEEQGNYITISGQSQRIKTVDDLVREMKIDLDVWKIDKVRVESYEAYRKNLQKSLTYEDGKATGEIVDEGKLTIEPLFIVEAKLVRIEPVAISPVISPVRINFTPVERMMPAASNPNGMKKALVLSDLHIGFKRDLLTNALTPFHDREAMGLVLQMVNDIFFDLIVVLGDTLDLAEWSDKFVRGPELYLTTQPAVTEATWFLGQLKALSPSSKVIVLEGNHDKRMEDFLIKHAYQMYGLRQGTKLTGPSIASVPYLLGLKEMGINYVGDYPNGKAWANDEFAFIHGVTVRGKSGATVSAVVDDIQHSVAFGHIHRQEYATRTARDRYGSKSVTAFTPGCLCKIDGTVPGSTTDNNWQQGLGIVNYFEDGRHSVLPVPIENGSTIYQDRIYTGKDYLEELRRDTGYNY